MIISIDIDDTITAAPSLFEVISSSEQINRCIVVSSRSNDSDTRSETEKELRLLNIHYNKLYLLESYEYADHHCPHRELDWHQRYLWQKVDICLKESVDIVFEDDEKVIKLFKSYAPDIKIFQVHK